MTCSHCLSCQAGSFTAVRYTDELSYLRCDGCGHLSLSSDSESPDRAYFKAQQKRYFHSNSIYLDRSNSWVETEAVRRRAQLIRKCLDTNSRLIEIGPGSGRLLKELLSSGYKIDVIEESEVLAEKLRIDTHQKVLVGEFEEQPLEPEEYHGLLTFHVVEHIPDVLTHFKQIHRILKPDGVLVLATPNADSWENNLPFSLSPNYDSSHVHIFTARSLENCLIAAGFEVVDIRTPEYATNWLRVITKVIRRINRRDELTTGGDYLRAASNRVHFFRLLLLGFSILSFPLRYAQEAFKAGNEILIVARKALDQT
jgi:SAM-dependent methyltransferase